MRVLLVDDNSSHRDLLRMLMGFELDFEVVGEAGDGERGVELAAELRPDLIVSDIEMPRLDGLRAVPRYRAAAPHAVVVLMSSRPPSDATKAATDAGADLYLDKGTGVETIISALRTATGNASGDARSPADNSTAWE